MPAVSEPTPAADNRRSRSGARAFRIVAVIIAISVVGVAVASYTVPEPQGGWPRELGIALWVAYGVSLQVLPICLWRSALWKRMTMNVWMNALGAAILLVFWFTDVLVFLVSMAVTAVTLPLRVAVAFNAVVFGAMFTISVTIAEHEMSPVDLALLVSIAVSVTAVGQLVRTINKLRKTRSALARLAVVDERNRVARDLHDLLGHSLTTISVKTGLARRLLESDIGNQAQALSELSDSERLARQAMTEVRAVVSQYRASLDNELAGVRQALESAGIQARVPGPADVVPARLHPAFAYVVREGVTNVMRHSRATSCEIRLGSNWIEVVDNGAVVATAKPGSGLTGLSERLAVVGGTVAAGPAPGGSGFRLRAFVPNEAT